MGDMPKRDITGNCEGECRDRVKEGEKERHVAFKIGAAKKYVPGGYGQKKSG